MISKQKNYYITMENKLKYKSGRISCIVLLYRKKEELKGFSTACHRNNGKVPTRR
jgi:hypothetical protein